MDRRSFLGAASVALAASHAAAAPAQTDRASSPPWKLNFAPNIGLTSPETGLFKESVGSNDPVAQIEWIADHGFAGIEDNALKVRTPADQTRIGEALHRRGLTMGCFVNNWDSWNKPLWNNTEAASQDQQHRDLLSSIDAAKRVNGRLLTTISGRDLRLPVSFQLQAMIENLKRAAPIAERAGVVLGIEATNENGFPGMLVHHVMDAYTVVQAVNSPAVRLVFDAFHVQVMDGDVINNLDRTYDAIGVFQIADNPGRVEPGVGEMNYVNILRHLRNKGYTGLVELEHSNSRPGIEGERSSFAALQAINEAI